MIDCIDVRTLSASDPLSVPGFRAQRNTKLDELRQRVAAGEQKATLARVLGSSRETVYRYPQV